MGMTIDEAIDFLEESKYSPYEAPSSCTIDLAIATMHKYQQIEKIIRNYDVAWEFHHMKPTIDKIREVIEDGNVKRRSN